MKRFVCFSLKLYVKKFLSASELVENSSGAFQQSLKFCLPTQQYKISSSIRTMEFLVH